MEGRREIVFPAFRITQERADQKRQHRRGAGGDPNVRAVTQLTNERAPHQRAELRPLVVPPNRPAFSFLHRRRWQQRRLFAAQRNLFDVLDQAKRFVLVAPELRRITARRHQLAAAVLLVNNVAAQIAQRRFQYVKDKFRSRRPARRTGTEIRAELVLVFGFGKIAKHFRRRPEKDQPAAFVEQERLVK